MLVGLLTVVLLLVGLLWVVGRGTLGESVGPGTITGPARTQAEVAGRFAVEREAAEEIGVARPKQILFGDLHVHSSFSLDAFLMGLPLMGGQGAHPIADACDFARYCSELDFWSINDHGLSLTTPRWKETIASLRECQAIAGSGDQPDLVSFLGWEWTQMGTNPDNHYGHKNVIFRGLDDDVIPKRPIFAPPPPEAPERDVANQPGPLVMGAVALALGSQGNDIARYFTEILEDPECAPDVPVRELDENCREGAPTPAELFAKLDDWGYPALVIPHGTSWGMYTPQGSSWAKQATSTLHDPKWQKLVEVYSGHGNSEEFRDWSAVTIAADGTKICPEPSADYLPSCWRAGEIIRQRCLDAGDSGTECEARAVAARQNYVDADISGHLTVPGVELEDWLDSGQCSDCFQPAFNMRPKSSVQYMMALGGFEDPKDPVRLRFGFLASSDVHSSRPGTGYKEYDRREMTEARLGGTADAPILGSEDVEVPEPRSVRFDPATSDVPFFARNEAERSASFFVTGGLVAVHSDGRDRDAVWEALDRREVYGTSGPRILLWFDLLNGPGDATLPMGSMTELSDAPVFEVRAVGSFDQKPGCSDAAVKALGEERIQWLCGGECLHPSDERRTISRIEVVRIRPQARKGEAIAPLIEDPWRVHGCRPSAEGCRFVFTDPEFVSSGRDAVYYVRAVEEPTQAINADNLRCDRDEKGACLQVHPCDPRPYDDDCLAETEQRAWSSPIFVDHAGKML